MKPFLLINIFLAPFFLFGQTISYDTSKTFNNHLNWTGIHYKNPDEKKSYDVWTFYYENGQKRLEEITDSAFTFHKLVNGWLPDGTQILKSGNGFLFDLGKDSTLSELKDSSYQGYCRVYRKYYRSGWGMSPWKLYATGNLLNGVKSGEWNYLDSSGIVKASANYDHGNVLGKCTLFYPRSKTIKETGNILNCQKNGRWKFYDSTGILLIECNYENGEKKGEYTSYYSNGKIKSKGQYTQESKKIKVSRENPNNPGTFEIHGKERFDFAPIKTGTWFFYNEVGELIDSKNYKNEMDDPEKFERINLKHKHYYYLQGVLFPSIPECNYH